MLIAFVLSDKGFAPGVVRNQPIETTAPTPQWFAVPVVNERLGPARN